MHFHRFTASIITAAYLTTLPSQACCPIGPLDRHVINTDQSVIMVWDKDKQTQHFIRKADFKTDAKDIGFIVPSPSKPDLSESGDAAFDQLAVITAPKKPRQQMSIPIGCSAPKSANYADSVVVIEQKRVAGFDATVLTATSGEALNEWLKENGYPYSPSVAAWAKPYLGGEWHFTALKLTKDEKARAEQELKAASLRISFKTDKPLFPYREPDSATASKTLQNNYRILRIYFIAESQYEGKIANKDWSGRTVWSGNITPHRELLLESLKLPNSTGPKEFWLTEFQDNWPYEIAAGDVYFSPVAKQMIIDRDGTNKPVKLDASWLLILTLSIFLKSRRRRSEP